MTSYIQDGIWHYDQRYYNPETGRSCSREEYEYTIRRLKNQISRYSSSDLYRPLPVPTNHLVIQPSVESKSENKLNNLLLLL